MAGDQCWAMATAASLHRFRSASANSQTEQCWLPIIPKTCRVRPQAM
jgi:hypothetical protein